MSNKKLINIMSGVFVVILLTALGFFIYDQYMERNFVPSPDLVREPVPPQAAPPRPDRVDPPQPIEEPLSENDNENSEPEYVPPPPPERDLLPRVIQLREYYGNPDIVGYLYIPNTNISYPVVQTGNNDFYLDYDIYLQPCRYGTVFVDYAANIHELWDDNTIIFGHNTRYGNKFHNIRNFHRADYFNARRYIYLTTPHAETVWETFSIFPTTTQYPSRDYMITNFPTIEMFYEFMLYLQSRSLHTTDVELTKNCQILILSTCATNNRARINRYILVARLVR